MTQELEIQIAIERAEMDMWMPNKRVKMEIQLGTVKARITRPTLKKKEPIEVDEETEDLGDGEETNENWVLFLFNIFIVPYYYYFYCNCNGQIKLCYHNVSIYIHYNYCIC